MTVDAVYFVEEAELSEILFCLERISHVEGNIFMHGCGDAAR